MTQKKKLMLGLVFTVLAVSAILLVLHTHTGDNAVTVELSETGRSITITFPEGTPAKEMPDDAKTKIFEFLDKYEMDHEFYLNMVMERWRSGATSCGISAPKTN